MRARLLELEAEVDARSDMQPDPTQTRVEPVRDPDTLTDGEDASNEPIAFGGEGPLNGAHLEERVGESTFNSLRDDPCRCWF